jgi:predicted DNA-binding antitoxin AbrB/MazE fold protein
MGHKIVEAVIENGVLKRVDKTLPSGKLTVHIIYDENQEALQEIEAEKIVKETSGIYRDINVEMESKKLRDSWERNVHQ